MLIDASVPLTVVVYAAVKYSASAAADSLNAKFAVDPSKAERSVMLVFDP